MKSSGTAEWRRGILGELNRIYEPDSAVVPKGLFGRVAQLARDILRIERAAKLDSRKDPHLDHGRGSGNLRPDENNVSAAAKQ